MKAFILLTSLALVACYGGGSNCPNGSEGCPCTASGLCDPPNECQGGVCVTPADTSTDTPLDAASDTATDDVISEVECTSNADCDDGNPCTADTCDLDYNECKHSPVDADEDGYPVMEVEGTACTGGTDCDDSRDDVYPGATETCDGVDNDCNGDLMDGPRDEDSDGYNDIACTGGDDCNDGDALAYPGAEIETCSLQDHDCNGEPDQDNDGDGHVSYLCALGDDCDDADVAVLLGECTGVNDCCDGCWQRNGCWLDPTTGYMWEDQPADEMIDGSSAVDYCVNLSLPGHGVGEWKLPTISELRSLIRGCPSSEVGGACGVDETCLDMACLHDCFGCTAWGGPGFGCYRDSALDGTCNLYWSSSSVGSSPISNWSIGFVTGQVGDAPIEDPNCLVRCVLIP